MEPGIPDPNSRASRLGIYNLDPAVRFWATPPVHGCLTLLRGASGRLHLQATPERQFRRRGHGGTFGGRNASGALRQRSNRVIWPW